MRDRFIWKNRWLAKPKKIRHAPRRRELKAIGSNFLPKPAHFCPKDQWSSHLLPTSPLTTGAFRAIIITNASLYKLAW